MTWNCVPRPRLATRPAAPDSGAQGQLPPRPPPRRALRADELGSTSRCSRRSINEIDWDVALFQEFPPAWKRSMAAACGADAHRAFSGRNWFQPLTSLIGRWRPDLLGAWEGGSNTTLVRPRRRAIADRHRVVLTRKPETRAMALTRMESGLCVANLHVSTKPSSAERELLDAAEQATAFAGPAPADLRGRLQRPAEGERGLRPARGPLRPRPSHRARPAQPSARARTGGHRASRRPASRGSRRPRSRHGTADPPLRPQPRDWEVLRYGIVPGDGDAHPRRRRAAPRSPRRAHGPSRASRPSATRWRRPSRSPATGSRR